MTQELRNELEKMEDIDFSELRQAIGIAEFARKIDLHKDSMCQKLEIEESDWTKIITAAYPFDLRMISKIQFVHEEVVALRAKEKADQLLQFPPYKYSEKPTPTAP
jgi:hypothetical protein